MHFRPILRTLSFIAALAVAACPGFAASARDKDKKKTPTPPPAAAGQRPAVVVDPSPVGQGARPGLVMSYADVLEPAQKAVISVYSTKIIKERVMVHPFFRQYFGIPEERESRQEGLGSGVIVTADGYILTNNHVVEGADELKVTLADDRDFIARVIGTDPKTDVAVLKIDGEKLPTVTLADSDKLRVGDVVFAVGNPLGVGQTVTMGIVSAKGRSKLRLLENVSGYEDFIQTDAAINMGNSGGALIDARGRLVGINSAILSPSRGNIGIGFAIPINLASFIMNSLAETGAVARGYLGVDADTITPEVAQQLGLPRDTRGVVITDIGAKTPPELKTADAILAIDDHPVTSREELRLLVAQMLPGSIAKLSIVRDGKPRTLEVKLGQVVENELLEGVSVEPLSPDSRRRLKLNDPRIDGLVIADVTADSAAAGRLRKDMLILEVNRTPVRDLRGAQQALTPERNLFTIYERGQIRGVVVIVR